MTVIRSFTVSDGAGCLRLFRDTVRRINSADYAPRQVAAWASDEIDEGAWIDRFSGRYAYLAEVAGRLAGFADMTPEGYLDRLFVSADHQRQGIATALVTQLIADAESAGIDTMVADVSITAVPFFARMGFTDPVEQTVERRGVSFTNYHMTRRRQLPARR